MAFNVIYKNNIKNPNWIYNNKKEIYQQIPLPYKKLIRVLLIKFISKLEILSNCSDKNYINDKLKKIPQQMLLKIERSICENDIKQFTGIYNK